MSASARRLLLRVAVGSLAACSVPGCSSAEVVDHVNRRQARERAERVGGEPIYPPPAEGVRDGFDWSDDPGVAGP